MLCKCKTLKQRFAVKILKRLSSVSETNNTKHIYKADLIAVLTLGLIPIIIDLSLALAGHPLLQGDNLNQNFPLRLLAGQQIGQGRLPVWNPYDWSGTPLLAGWNAGALYPGEFLFLIFSPIIAWSLNLALASSIAGIGAYLFLKRLKTSATAAFFGAVAFTYTGFFLGQQVHMGLIEGTAFMPWILLALDSLPKAEAKPKKTALALLIAISSGCTVLAGDPRAVTTSAIAATLYLVALLFRTKQARQRISLAIYSIAGAGLGAGLSAIQWLPGLSFLHNSSRSTYKYKFYTQGSLSILRLTMHLALPYIKGTATNFGTPTYQGNYNLPEVTIGVGFIALAAAFSYLPILFGQFWQFIRFWKNKDRKKSYYSKPLAIWYVTAFVGLILSMGGYTPIGHLLFHIPLFGGERLQNRNAELIDLSLTVLLAFFIDDHTKHKLHTGDIVDDTLPTSLATWRQRFLASLPLVCSIGLVIFAYIDPLGFEAKISLHVRTSGFYDALDPYLIPTLITAVSITIYLLFGHKLKSHWRNSVLFILLFADLGIYPTFAGYQTFDLAAVTKNSPVAKAIAGITGADGRVALYNQTFFTPADYPNATAQLGIPDINIWQNVLSVQGYGSAVSGDYENITNTHQLESLQATELDGNVYNYLNLKTMMSSPISFGEDIPPYSAIPVAGGAPVTATGLPGSTKNAPAPSPGATGPVIVRPHTNKIFFLPYVHTIKRVTVVTNNVSFKPVIIGVAPGKIIADTTIGNLYSAQDSGSVHYRTDMRDRHFLKSITQPVFDREVHISFIPTKANAIKISDDSSSPLIIGAVVVVTQHPDTRFLADGSLEGNINPKQWAFAGVLKGFSVFVNSDNNGLAWLQNSSTISPESHNTIAKTAGKNGSVRLTSSPTALSPQYIINSKHKQVLVISEAYAPGWTARVTSLATHSTTVKTVKQFGLISSVDIGKGRYAVKLVYAPTSLLEGIILSAASILLMFAWLIFILRKKRRPGKEVLS